MLSSTNQSIQTVEFPLKPDEPYLQKGYAKYRCFLIKATNGKVVTRFLVDSSHPLHIGNIKSAMINYHFSRMFEGRMIVRIEDGNLYISSKDILDTILVDLLALDIKYSLVTYTSDNFEKLLDIMTNLIKEGKCYCDNTPVHEIREQREKGISSPCRSFTSYENFTIWEKMIKGEAPEFCVRGKGNMQARDKNLRDPVLYICRKGDHPRTGNKYKVYPTYDFSCPVIDFIQGITHVMDFESTFDSMEKYNWIIGMFSLRPVIHQELARLNFSRVSLSKKVLLWFINTNRVEGWDDPRFPTVRGLLRRGLQIVTLVEYMLNQAPSRSISHRNPAEIWALNAKNIDPVTGRYSAISKKNICTLILSNGPYNSELQTFHVPLHPKNADLGMKPQLRCNELYLEYEDAITLQEGEKFTLMKWGNAIVTRIEKDGEALTIRADLLEDDKDFKSTKKVTWLPKTELLVEVLLIEYDYLINVDILDSFSDLNSVVNENTKFVVEAFADPEIKNLKRDVILQFERKGYFIIDKIKQEENSRYKYEMICVPDGRTKLKK